MITKGRARSVSRRMLFKNVGGINVGRSGGAGVTATAEETIEWTGTKNNDATETELYLNGLSGDRLTLDVEQILHFNYYAVITDTSNLESVVLEFTGIVKRDSSNNVALVGQIFRRIFLQEFSGWDINFEADNTNKALIVKATGVTGKILQFHVSEKPNIIL